MLLVLKKLNVLFIPGELWKILLANNPIQEEDKERTIWSQQFYNKNISIKLSPWKNPIRYKLGDFMETKITRYFRNPTSYWKDMAYFFSAVSELRTWAIVSLHNYLSLALTNNCLFFFYYTTPCFEIIYTSSLFPLLLHVLSVLDSPNPVSSFWLRNVNCLFLILSISVRFGSMFHKPSSLHAFSVVRILSILL